MEENRKKIGLIFADVDGTRQEIVETKSCLAVWLDDVGDVYTVSDIRCKGVDLVALYNGLEKIQEDIVAIMPKVRLFNELARLKENEQDGGAE